VRGHGVDARTDIYALGATMYHALSGHYPFDAPTMHALLYAIAESRPIALASLDASIDPRVVAVVERAMQKDPAMRFQSAAEMRAALTMPHPSVAPAHAPPASKSNAALIGGVIAGVFLLLLALVGAGIFVFFMRSPEPEAKVAVTPPATAPVAVAPPVTASASAEPVTTTTKKTSPKPTPSASAAPPKTAMGGTNPRYSGGTYHKPIKSADVRPAIDGALPAIKQCFVATELDPPEHRISWWTVVVDASGIVTSATRKDVNYAHPKLDACVTAALRAMKVPPVEGGGTFDMSLFAPLKGE
jgi:eukaryotic-like serine/threonine-protein kinase